MAMIGTIEQTHISDAIAEVERHTDAELVTVLAAASDDYRYIPLLWAALVAMIVPSALYLTPLSVAWMITAQLAVFLVLAVVLQTDTLRARLIPGNVRALRAANMARRQFLEQDLHHTDGDTGVLIFVSEAEHYVEILVDRGISAKVDNDRWSSIIEGFVADVREDRVEQGFLTALERCGEILAEAVPKTPDNHNELDNRLILVGYD
ncbi:MAG: TPM domain-containing protein [Gammaproteobacteria bacterium]|nr:TPM domain-containing protein [Gammaproteobacteria bacterium]MCZ6856282.1 TPM domain-containing protein [Gammaproteobacteria bacterium]